MTGDKWMALMTVISPTVLKLHKVIQSSHLNTEQQVAALLVLAAVELERGVALSTITDELKDRGGDLALQAINGGPVVMMSLLASLSMDLTEMLQEVRAVRAAEEIARDAGRNA